MDRGNARGQGTADKSETDKNCTQFWSTIKINVMTKIDRPIVNQ